MIPFDCPHCHTALSAEDGHAGAPSQCPSCGAGLIVPPNKSTGPPPLPLSHSIDTLAGAVRDIRGDLAPAAAKLAEKGRELLTKAGDAVRGHSAQEPATSPPSLESPIAAYRPSGPNTAQHSPTPRNSRMMKLGGLGIALLFLLVWGISGGEERRKSEPTSTPTPQASFKTPKTMQCFNCRGTGRKVVPCIQCHGARTIRAASGFEMVCPKCQGQAAVAVTCRACGGAGQIPYSRDALYARPEGDYNPNTGDSY